ncbi:MAG: STAS domain-containing protein [Planctomycetes bacterium]|nr:STAS domain-containing protein [Planctomycetota bacterium]
MRIAFAECGSCLVASLEGETFTHADAKDYGALFEQVLQTLRPGRTLVLDLSRVDYMRSSGLGAILHLLDQVKALPARLVIASHPTLSKNLFSIAELPRLVALYPSVEEAVRAASAGGPAEAGGTA